MIVKVCGMRDPDNIRAVEALGVDWMGFIFYSKSPRLAPCDAPAYLPSACRRVGVFVNASLEEIASRVRGYSLDMVQLHGSESPELCRQLSRLLPGVDLIKAMQVRSAEDLTRASEYSGAVSWLLFDTPTAGFGGSGKSFDWSLLAGYEGEVPFILSGGIGPDSVEAISSLRHPAFAGVDLNSRFETAPGLKDVDAVRAFIESLKEKIQS